jgi:hypothetical protein
MLRPSTVSIAILVLAAAGAAWAQDPPPSPRQACRASAISLCPKEVAARDRDAARACLIKNFDKVSPECQAAMKAVQARDMATKPDAMPPKP